MAYASNPQSDVPLNSPEMVSHCDVGEVEEYDLPHDLLYSCFDG